MNTNMRLAATLYLPLALLITTATIADEPFRPEVGKFPPLEKATSWRGQLAFVDHANRRGSIRLQGDGAFYRSQPQPFAMLPYGIVRYHGAPADLRDIPIGTVLYGRAFLPPDPKASVVPVVPSGNPNRPPENHVVLLEDAPSFCLREGKIWKLKEIELNKNDGTLVASLEPKEGGDSTGKVESMTLDASTRIWRGREQIGLDELTAEGVWPATGKKSLDGMPVQLGITWCPDRVGLGATSKFNQFKVSDIWQDEASLRHASKLQTEVHKTFIRTRWMPAWVDHVEYGTAGRATLTLTLFGGMDESLYSEFKKGDQTMIAAADNTLKFSSAAYTPAQNAMRGPILEVKKSEGEPPLGSSGIQIRVETQLIIEGGRPGRVVRIWAQGWSEGFLPVEEYANVGDFDQRFPNPNVFPKY